MSAIALALVSALAWGVADFVGGLQTKRVAVTVVLLVAFGLEVGTFLLVVLASGDPWPGLDVLWPALAGGAAGTISAACLFSGLAIGTMSVVAPISGLSAGLPVVVGVATGDALSALQPVGMVAATGGAILASRERHEDEIRAGDARLGVLLGLGAALGLGCYYVGTDAAADASVWWSLLASRTVSLALIAPAVFARRPAVPSTVPAFVPLAMIGALDLVASTSFVVSSTVGLLSVVSVIAALYPLVTVLLAMALLRERIRPIQSVGVALAFAGVGLMTAG
jgi:drug/metabolite transporter (DMT)-like permease